MASAANTKPFHTYENVGFDQPLLVSQVVGGFAPPAGLSCSPAPSPPPPPPPSNAATETTTSTNSRNHNSSLTNSPNKFISSNGFAQATASLSLVPNLAANSGASIAVNKAALESPFADPLLAVVADSSQPTSAKILSTIDASGTTMRMLTSASISSCGVSAPTLASTTATVTAAAATAAANGTPNCGASKSICAQSATTAATPAALAASRSGLSGHNLLVTKLITFPPQSPMDSLREWSLSTFKCTKQLINEKRGLCAVTSDQQLQSDIEQLRENREKILQMLRLGQTMTSQYTQLVRSQKQLHSLMNEMSIKCNSFSLGGGGATNQLASSNQSNGSTYKLSSLSTSLAAAAAAAAASSASASSMAGGKQVVANFSSLSNNLCSSTTTSGGGGGGGGGGRPAASTSPNSHSSNRAERHQEVLNHMRTFANTNLVDDFKRSAISLHAAIKNGEKLVAALSFYCSNLSTLVDKTIEDSLLTVRQYESARLEYDAEKNSLNLNDCLPPNASQSATSMANYSSDKVELARLRYEQLREDVLIKLRFLEENTIKVMHKQLLLFNGAFASYASGNSAALDSTLKQFCIKDAS